MLKKEVKRSQVTVFVIIAVVIVAAVILVLALRNPSVSESEVPASLQAPYNSFLSCLESDATLGIQLLESQGGYIELPDFEPGSPYAPFSSQLNFMGNPIPYWYYVSGNNIQKEQVPTKEDMASQISRFVSERISGCDLSTYYAEYSIDFGEPSVRATIGSDGVEVLVSMDLDLSDGEDSVEIKNHRIFVDSKLGNLYDSARKVYDKEQSELFLENYTIDFLNAYAPVDGVEFSCSPKIWDARNVFEDLKDGIVANTAALKNQGNSDDYFVLDLGVGEEVRFLTSKNWSRDLEVEPSDGSILIAKPVGNQPEFGILGFCYVPYHFVYDVKYPVLVQVYDGDEIFQFPLAVVIDNNNPRESLDASAIYPQDSQICEYKNAQASVGVRDLQNDLVSGAELFYECSGTSCYIGTASGGSFEGAFPSCVNGRLVARAPGYEEGSSIFSTVGGGSTQVYLEKIYPLEVVLNVDSKSYSGRAIISFSSEDSTKTINYPDQKSIELSQGSYNVSVYTFSEGNLDLGSNTIQQCVDVPKGGIGGLIGLTEKKCFDVDVPEQIISDVLSGGGKTGVYVLENTLENNNKIEIFAKSLPEPETLEALQLNYVLWEQGTVEVEFS